MLAFVFQKTSKKASISGICFTATTDTFSVVAELETVNDVDVKTILKSQFDKVYVINICCLDSNGSGPRQRFNQRFIADFSLGIGISRSKSAWKVTSSILATSVPTIDFETRIAMSISPR